jgi:hypothetical protein
MVPTFKLLSHLRNSFGEKSFVSKLKSEPNETGKGLMNVEGARRQAVGPVVK